MAEKTEIAWCDSTFNPWEGCQKVGPGCDNCYAEARNARFGRGTAINWGPGAPRRRTSPANWRKPLQWNKAHAAFYATHGRRQRVFCASLADVWDNEVPIEWLVDFLDLCRRTPNLDKLILTKRIGNVMKRLSEALQFVLAVRCDSGADTRWGSPELEAWIKAWLEGSPPSDIWLGATIVNQEEADRDIPKLLATPARVRFLSMEPLLGPVDIRRFMWPVHPRWPAKYRSPSEAIAAGAEVTYHRQALLGAHVPLVTWVIVGGESGPHARPMHPDWVRSLRDQCAAAGVPFLLKQWGEWAPDDHFTSLRHQLHEWGDGDEITGRSWRQGKKAAGRLLDGVTHDGFPEVQGV